MKTRSMKLNLLSLCVTAWAVAALISACGPASTPTVPPVGDPTATLAALPTMAPSATVEPAQPTSPPAAAGEITLDLSGAAQGMLVETLAGVSEEAGGPYWEIAPEYRRVTLEGYPVTGHLLKPQVLVYPMEGIKATSENAWRIAAYLQELLQTRQARDYMPFLPMFRAQQVMSAQAQYLDFKNGTGVRYLTQYDQAPLPINNHELVYTFQGITSDGRYYIAAVLPVNHPELPASELSGEGQAAWIEDFPAYLVETTAWLEKQPAGSFTPDLAALDALVQSIEVR